jgi:hypothetical protein
VGRVLRGGAEIAGFAHPYYMVPILIVVVPQD